MRAWEQADSLYIWSSRFKLAGFRCGQEKIAIMGMTRVRLAFDAGPREAGDATQPGGERADSLDPNRPVSVARSGLSAFDVSGR